MSFTEDLKFSHNMSDLPVWEAIYRQAFPLFLSMVDYRHEGNHQRRGIDRIIFMRNGKSVAVDEKVRRKHYPIAEILGGFDVALEFISVDTQNKPGWVCNPDIDADYIAYAIKPLGKGVLLPVLQLQSAWERNKETWLSEYRRGIADNRDRRTGRLMYRTHNCCVPVNVLMRAIGGELRFFFPVDSI